MDVAGAGAEDDEGEEAAAASALSGEEKDRTWARLLNHARNGELRFVRQAPEKPDGKKKQRVGCHVHRQNEADALDKVAMPLDDPSLGCVLGSLKTMHPQNSTTPSLPLPLPSCTPPSSQPRLTSRYDFLPYPIHHPSLFFLRSRAAAEAHGGGAGVRMVAPWDVRSLALGIGDEATWYSTPSVDQRAVLEVVGRSRRRGVDSSQLVNLTPDLKKPQEVSYVLNMLNACGVIVKREAKARASNTSKVTRVHLTCFAQEEFQGIVTEKTVESFAGVCENALKATVNGLLIVSDVQAALWNHMTGQGWSVNELRVSGRFNKIFGRVRDHLIKTGVAEKIIVRVVDEAGEGKGIERRAPCLRLLSAKGKEEVPPALPTVGEATAEAGGTAEAEETVTVAETAEAETEGVAVTTYCSQLTVEDRMEDQVVALAKAARAQGVKVPDLAKAFRIPNKEFKKRIDNIARFPELFGCILEMRQDGKYKVSYLISRIHAGSSSVSSSERAGGKSAAEVLRANRAALLCNHIAERGYAVKAFMGRWLAQQEGSKVERLDKKVMDRIVDELVEEGKVRRIALKIIHDAKLSVSATTKTVLLDPGFPDPTDEMLEAMRQEIKQTEYAMKLEFWKAKKDIYNIWPPDREVATARGAGNQTTHDIVPANTAEGDAELTVTIKTEGLRLSHAGPSDFIRAHSTPARKLPFKTFRDLSALETGFIRATALRAKYMHEFLVKAVFENHNNLPTAPDMPRDETRSAWFDAGKVVMKCMPLELFLRIIGCPTRIADESPKTLAMLQCLAIQGVLLGDIGNRSKEAALAVLAGADQKLSKLLNLLSEMDLIKSGRDKGVEYHCLARVGRFQPTPRAEAETDWEEHDVETVTGCTAFWGGLESAFKGKYSGGQKCGPEDDMTASWPNPGAIRIMGDNQANTKGFCHPRVWSRLRDMKIDQRVVLLKELENLRMKGNIEELSAHDTAADEEAEARKAARAVALEQSSLSSMELRQLANSIGLSIQQVRFFYEQDCMRILNCLIADGTITREEAMAAERRRNAAKQQKNLLDRAKRQSTATTIRADRIAIGEKLAKEAAHVTAYRMKGEPSEGTVAVGAAAIDPAADGDDDEEDDVEDLAMRAQDAVLPARISRKRGKNVGWTDDGDRQLTLAVMRTCVRSYGDTLSTRYLEEADNRETLPAERNACGRRFRQIMVGKRGEEIMKIVKDISARGAAGRNKFIARYTLEMKIGSQDTASPTSAPAAASAASDPTTLWDSKGEWCEELDLELTAAVDRIFADTPMPHYSQAHHRLNIPADDDMPIGYGIRGKFLGDEDDEVPLAGLLRRAGPEMSESSSSSEDDSDDSSGDDTSGDELGHRRKRRRKGGHDGSEDHGKIALDDEHPIGHDPEFVTRCANALELIKMLMLTAVPGVPAEKSLKTALDALGGDAVAFAMNSLTKAKLVVPAKVPRDAGGEEEAKSSHEWTLSDRFHRQADDVAVLGSVGARASAEAARSLEAATAAEVAAKAEPQGPTISAQGVRCLRPTSAQNLALLSAVVAGDAELAPTTADLAARLDECFPVHPPEGADHDPFALPGAAVNLQVVVRPLPRMKRRRLDDTTTERSAEEVDAPPHPDLDTVLTAVRSAGATGLTARELAADPAVAALGVDVARCEAKLEAAAAEGAVDAVNGFYDVRYMTPAHGARFRLDGEKGVPIRPWLMPDGSTNAPFLAGLKRRVLGVVLQRPGVPEGEVVRTMAQVLTRHCAREVVRMMVAAKELTVREAVAECARAPPLALMRQSGAGTAVAREPPVRHLFAPLNPALWPR